MFERTICAAPTPTIRTTLPAFFTSTISDYLLTAFCTFIIKPIIVTLSTRTIDTDYTATGNTLLFIFATTTLATDTKARLCYASISSSLLLNTTLLTFVTTVAHLLHVLQTIDLTMIRLPYALPLLSTTAISTTTFTGGLGKG